jgi:hypothetical protein
VEGGAETGGEFRRPATEGHRPTRRSATLLAVLAVAMVAFLPVGAAWAVFTKQVTASANTLSAASSFPRCYSDAVLGDSPVSYWRLDETSGTTATDSTGGRNGTYTNGPTIAQSGAVPDGINNRSASVDGVNDYVNVPYASALNPATFTVEGWGKVTGGSGTWRLLASSWSYPSPSDHRGYWIGVDTSNRWTVHIGNGSVTEVSVDGPVVTVNAWTHVAATYDGAALKLFVNGVLVGNLATSTYAANASPVAFEIGAEYYNASRTSFFLGGIDDVALYSSVLSATQLRTHYNAGRCSKDGVLADNPLGYWRLGESSGTTAVDGVRGRHGTYAGAPTLGAAGALNGDADTSVTFNGSSQYVSVPYDSALNPAQFTVEAWAKPTGGSQYRSLLSSMEDAGGGASWRGYWLGINPSNKWEAEVSQSGGPVTALTSPGTVSTSTWTHLCLTYDGTTMTFYVDGVLVGSQTTSYRQVSGVPLAIATGLYNGSTASELFPGSVDEVTVYGSALSQARIQAHYLLGRSYKDGVLDSGPVSYWRLGESSGTSAADVKAANAGTYQNSPTLGKAGALGGDADTSVGVNGTSSYVSVPYSASLNPAQFTVEAWAQWDGTRTGAWRTVAGTWNDVTNNGGYWLGISTQDKWYVSTQGASAAASEIQGTAPTAGQWVHLATTYDGSYLRLYVNGTEVGNLQGPNYTTQSSVPLGMGTNVYSGGAGDRFGGVLDDVAVYNRALSAAEVQLHYDSGRQ